MDLPISDQAIQSNQRSYLTFINEQISKISFIADHSYYLLVLSSVMRLRKTKKFDGNSDSLA